MGLRQPVQRGDREHRQDRPEEGEDEQGEDSDQPKASEVLHPVEHRSPRTQRWHLMKFSDACEHPIERPRSSTMTSSIAVLSDIHGVLPVLDAVLAQADVAAADLIVVTGDHAHHEGAP